MNQLTPSHKFHVSRMGLVAIGVLLAAFLAIFVLKINTGLVINYGLIIFMIMSHFLMHSRHTNHNTHKRKTDSEVGLGNLSSIPIESNEGQNRSHGCH